MSTTMDGPPRDWKEGRRLRALELHEQGYKGIHIAAALGVTRGAVSQWLAAARTGRRAALRRRPAGPGKLLAVARASPVRRAAPTALTEPEKHGLVLCELMAAFPSATD